MVCAHQHTCKQTETSSETNSNKHACQTEKVTCQLPQTFAYLLANIERNTCSNGIINRNRAKEENTGCIECMQRWSATDEHHVTTAKQHATDKSMHSSIDAENYLKNIHMHQQGQTLLSRVQTTKNQKVFRSGSRKCATFRIYARRPVPDSGRRFK